MAEINVLVVDDDAGVREGVRDYLESAGYAVTEADSAEAALRSVQQARPDIAILDYQLRDADAQEVIPKLKELDETLAIVVLTGFGSIERAVATIKLGADHFLTKPTEMSLLDMVLRRLAGERRARRGQTLARMRAERDEIDPLLGASAAMQQLRQHVGKLIDVSVPVLLQGESGTGKTLLANWLHTRSARAEESFVAVNCAALPRDLLEAELFGYQKGAFSGATAAKPGLLELADKGTILFDEIGDLDLSLQPKLLQAIEEKRFRRLGEVRERRVSARLLCATHQDLGDAVKTGKFRADLYFRIAGLVLRVPPLRERLEDLPLLAQNILAHSGKDLGRPNLRLCEEATQQMLAYRWPGNVRELRNVLERAAILSDSEVLTADTLSLQGVSAPTSSAYSADWTLNQLERFHIEQTLRREQGHVERAAAKLGIPRSTLYQRIKEFGITTQ